MAIPAEPVEQLAHGPAPHPRRLLGDRRQRRVGVGREIDVVEADHADVARNSQPAAADRAHRADGTEVVVGEDAAECRLAIQQQMRRRRTAGHVAIALCHQQVGRIKAGPAKGFACPLESLGRGLVSARGADVPDPTMAQRDEVLDRQSRAQPVVAQDRRQGRRR